MNASRYDRLRVDYTSAISLECRDEVLAAITAVVDSHGYYSKSHYDKSMGAWSVNVTAYDPTKLSFRPLSDEAVNLLVRDAANRYGISVEDLMLALAKDV